MTYVVNGTEFSTKKDATVALFDAAEKGEAATLTKVEPEPEEETVETAEVTNNLAGGIAVVP